MKKKTTLKIIVAFVMMIGISFTYYYYNLEYYYFQFTKWTSILSNIF